ncbi:MAG: hypothetical protein U9Q76_08945 [candidate division WOR-3 bacterium]|nr:hypothetical protein [candidate division WOR-3 bacterium]
MARTKQKGVKQRQPDSTTIIVWVLFGLLIVSGFINVFTILSIQGLKRTVNEMRDPVNNYFSKRLDVMEAELDEFVKITSEDGKSPYAGDVKRMRKDIEKTHELWAKTSRVSGVRWVNLYWKAQRAQDKTEKAWEKLKAKHSP